MSQHGCAGETGRNRFGGTATQYPETVRSGSPAKLLQKGDKLMTPGRTTGASGARREVR